MKKSIIALALILVTASIAYCSSDEFKNVVSASSSSSSFNSVYSPKNIDLSKINWLQRYPQLKNIPANSQTATIDKLRTSESISALIGPIDNPYGVRNDILDAILTIVPKDNPQMLQAAIKEAYYENLATYSTSDEDKLNYVRKSSLTVLCMMLVDNDTSKDSLNVSRTIAHKMRDTDARDELVHHLETTVFAWQTLGTGLGSTAEEDLCKSGEY